jgi:hypothetical protein
MEFGLLLGIRRRVGKIRRQRNGLKNEESNRSRGDVSSLSFVVRQKVA